MSRAFTVYGGDADNGSQLVWPKGMRAVSLGDYDKLQAALWKYGKHLMSCRRQTDMTSWCDCGWDKLRETLAPERVPPMDDEPGDGLGIWRHNL